MRRSYRHSFQNIWRDDPDGTSEHRSEFRCDILDMLSRTFYEHDGLQVISSPLQFTLERIKDFIGRRLAGLTFGRYVSVHRVFEQLLKALDPVIVTHMVYSNGHPIDTNGSTTARLFVIFGRPGLGLQGCLNDVCVSVAP